MYKIYLVDSIENASKVNDQTPYMLVELEKIDSIINEHTGLLTIGSGGKFFKGVFAGEVGPILTSFEYLRVESDKKIKEFQESIPAVEEVVEVEAKEIKFNPKK
jgi:hypothetical protein